MKGCSQSVLICWNEDRLVAFTLDSKDVCIAVPTGTTSEYIGKTKEYILLAMSSIFHYPTVWHIRPEGY